MREIHAATGARNSLAELVEVPNADSHVTLDDPQGFIEALDPFPHS